MSSTADEVHGHRHDHGYSVQTEGALLCIEAASAWALMIGSLTLVLLRIGTGLGGQYLHRCPASPHRDHHGSGPL
ncbi:hypothetical protein [Parasynechococcus sp.]|uniref:hypothetical protein n=1 Tax=Parasynechococcus sp. TaxID=3101203 RepID=UPI0037041852